MRVPVLQQQRVASNQLPSVAPYLRNPDTSLAEASYAVGRGVAGLARQADAALTEEQAASAKARQEALSLQEADKLLEQQERAQRRLKGDSKTKSEGFLTMRGLRASEVSADVIEGLEKDREEIAAGISDPQAKQRFLVKSREQLLAFRGQVESHTAKEFEGARDATLKARMGQAIGMAESGVTNFDAWLAVSRQVESEIDGLAPSAEAAEAVKVAFRADNAFALTKGLLAQGRVDEAVTYVRENRGHLGKNFSEASALVQRATAGAEKDRLAAEGAKLVDGSAEAVRTADGYVTEEELRRAVNLEEVPPEVRDEVESALNRRIRLEEGKLREDIGKQRDNANRADLDGQPIPGATEDFLRKYDPDFLLARKARKAAEFRAWKASKAGDARTRAAADRAQKALDAEFLARWNTELVRNPAADADEFVTAFIAEKAKDGDEVTVSDLARAKAGESGAKAGKKAETAEGAAERSAAKRFEQTLSRAFKQKGKNLDQKLLNERVGRALQVYEQRLEAKGKPLDEAELAGIEAELLRDVTVSEPGRFWGTNEVKKKAVDIVPETTPSEEKSVGGKTYVKKNGKWVLK